MLTIAIQAGGESRRMGRDKGLVPFLGQPLVQRCAQRMASSADELIVTTNKPADYAFLGLPLYEDIRKGRGALGGFFTALTYASQPFVAIVACDMPFASPALLRHQANLLESTNADAAIPLLEDGYEPLHAVYRRESCLNAVTWAIDNDQWRLTSWFSRVNVVAMSKDDCLLLDPAGLAFSNANTPEELAEAEARARQMDG